MSGSVLIVDDDATVRRSLTTVLERAGFAVTTAEDAVPAMQMAGEFDAVVVDFNMQTATGDAVVRHFKARLGSRVLCLVLSGEDNAETSTRCLEAGADAVLQKPVSPASLRRYLADGLSALRPAA
jgi:DNA-binding response OmpR family regulator